jgi:hypothetical protein
MKMKANLFLLLKELCIPEMSGRVVVWFRGDC